MNASTFPNKPIQGNLADIVQTDEVPEKFYLSPQACKGILRRKFERDIKMNLELQRLLTIISEELKYQDAWKEKQPINWFWRQAGWRSTLELCTKKHIAEYEPIYI